MDPDPTVPTTPDAAAPPPVPDAPAVQPFLEVLRLHREGALHEELSEALQALVGRVQAVGKKGTLTMVLEVRPAGRSHPQGHPGQLYLLDDVKLKLPEPEREERLFFVDGNGHLSRTNFWQAELPGLRQVPDPRGQAPREVE